MDGAYDATIAVVADEDVRAARAAARGHHAVDERAARQLSQDEKAARATYVVANSGTVEELEHKLAAVLAKLVGDVSARTPTAAARARRAPRAPRAAVRRRRRTAVRRRRLALGAVLVLAAAAALALLPPFADKAVKELALPLRHDDIIRQQAADKDLDPALIAAVIYAESHFRNGQTSQRRARSGSCRSRRRPRSDIARRSGGTTFVIGDLADPQVNISYGAYYLRYLLDHYGGNEAFAHRGLQRGRGQRRPLDRGRPRGGPRAEPGGDPVPRDARSTSSACEQRASSTATPTPPSSGSTDGCRSGGYGVEVPEFKLDPIFTPAADQPEAIDDAGGRRVEAASASRRCWARPAPARR